MACVYWVRLPEHTDIFTEGYVGVTKFTAEWRYRRHVSKAFRNKKNGRFVNAIRKYGDKGLIVETVLIADEDYCYSVEGKLRPTYQTGWNTNEGGEWIGRGISTEAKKHLTKRTSSLWKDDVDFSDRMREVAVGSRVVERPRSGFWRYSRPSPLIQVADVIYIEYVKDPTAYAVEILNRITIQADTANIHSTLCLMRKFAGGWNPTSDKLWLHDFKDLSTDDLPPHLSYPEGWLVCRDNTQVWKCADVIYSLVHMGWTCTQIGGLYGISRNPIRVISKRVKDGWNPNNDPRWKDWVSSLTHKGDNDVP